MIKLRTVGMQGSPCQLVVPKDLENKVRQQVLVAVLRFISLKHRDSTFVHAAVSRGSTSVLPVATLCSDCTRLLSAKADGYECPIIFQCGYYDVVVLGLCSYAAFSTLCTPRFWARIE